MTEAEACAAEVVALHALFESWLGAGQGDAARFEAAFDPGFAMVMPDGRKLDRAGVLDMLARGRGLRGAGFRIAVEDLAVLHAAPPLLLMHYVERQWLTGGVETARRAAALFRLAPGGPRWVFVQETWVTPPPA
ncbi:hypothetical protein [Falsiroseomonas sp. CW058]|uniref:hypothetical protein n=1 Tax=Falsiroseomonas sp. CW058 TaxID=3388664 RepID=UPI003D311F91